MGRNRLVRAGIPLAAFALLVVGFLADAAAPAGASQPNSAAAHAATLYVSPSGQPAGSDTSCATAAYNTIESAIKASSPGGSVVVCPGTYHEQVVIPESLSVKGRGATIDEIGVPQSSLLTVTIPHVGTLTIFAGVVITASNVSFTGFTVKDAPGEGILAAGVTGEISNVTIDYDVVMHNDLGGGVPPASPYFECQPMGPVPGDCGEGVHLLTVADSRITHDTVTGNSGGILLTDEVGPTHNNLIADNTVSDNATDCGITVPGHNPNALNSQGVPQPGVAGVYDNAIIGNKVIDNGLLGDGAGVLFANASAGTASYDNLVAHNYISGNGLSGVTMHAHTIAPGQFEDLSGNAIIDNVIGPNNLDGDPLDGTVKDDRTTGVLVFSGGTPVQVTVAYNQIFSNHFGIWTSKVVSSTGLRTNSFRHVIAPLSLDH